MNYRLELERVMPPAPARVTRRGLPERSAARRPYRHRVASILQEHQHYLSFKIDKRRCEWLAGRMAAKRLVHKMIESIGISIKDDKIAIEQTADGVPFAQAGASSWPLSISHSGDWAAAAIPEDCRGTLIGIDIEKIEARDPAWLYIAFHPAERAENLDSEGQTRSGQRKKPSQAARLGFVPIYSISVSG